MMKAIFSIQVMLAMNCLEAIIVIFGEDVYGISLLGSHQGHVGYWEEEFHGCLSILGMQ